MLSASSGIRFKRNNTNAFSSKGLGALMGSGAKHGHFILRAFMGFKTSRSVLCTGGPRVNASILVSIIDRVHRRVVSLNNRFYFRARIASISLASGALGLIRLSRGSTRRMSTKTTIFTVNRDTHSAFRVLCGRRVPVHTGSFTIKIHVRRPRALVSRSRCKESQKGSLPTTTCGLARGLRGKEKICAFYVYPNKCIMGTSSRRRHLTIGKVDCRSHTKRGTGDTIVIAIAPSSFNSSRPLTKVSFRHDLRRGTCRTKRKGIPIRHFNSFGRGRVAATCKGIRSYVGKTSIFNSMQNVFPTRVTRSLRSKVATVSRGVRKFTSGSTLLSNIRDQASSPMEVRESRGFIYTSYS